jgi:hypothetical protein
MPSGTAGHFAPLGPDSIDFLEHRVTVVRRRSVNVAALERGPELFVRRYSRWPQALIRK